MKALSAVQVQHITVLICYAREPFDQNRSESQSSAISTSADGRKLFVATFRSKHRRFYARSLFERGEVLDRLTNCLRKCQQFIQSHRIGRALVRSPCRRATAKSRHYRVRRTSGRSVPARESSKQIARPLHSFTGLLTRFSRRAHLLKSIRSR